MSLYMLEPQKVVDNVLVRVSYRYGEDWALKNNIWIYMFIVPQKPYLRNNANNLPKA